MEEFIAALLRILIGIGKIILEISLVEALCFYTGKGVIALVTFGKYPHKPIDEDSRFKISLFGLLCLISMLLSIGLYNAYYSG